ncbi:Disease resistance family protein [Rhynchospora pubera]|uniref:Disease resistance family protein n=1 Tax=Rhynchospora pubera TaxID=906938 RepID=A0AAV8E5M4_9POAL|nr:Disease resistance family protein [Rhynchospora pubera]
MDWHSNSDCIDILAMSYEDMPSYLKTCFLYLAFLPEDFEISAPCLIRMWVAEGFMPQHESKTMEEIAEDCLEQLFQRSMVQVLRQDANGSIEYFRVHDLLRDFAMRQAGKENFITALANPPNTNHCNRAARRASLHACGPQFMDYVGPKTRSLFLFRLESNLPNYTKFRLLRVLEIVFVRTHEVINLRGVDRLIHLKYLGVRGTGHCTELDMSEFSFGCLKNLETLDIQKTTANIPTDLWTINTLRHVTNDLRLPEIPSTAELRNLQTLEWIPIKNKIIPHLNKLQKLGLIFKWWSLDVVYAVSHLFGGLSSLTSLAIKGNNFPMEIVYPKGLPNYQNLQILHLNGNWSKSVTLEAKLFPKNLVKLTLQDSHLGQDPMPELGKLNSLKELRLITCVDNVKQMICPAGFPVLEKLHIWCLSTVQKLTVANEVMPRLKSISTFPTKCELPLKLMHLIPERERTNDDPTIISLSLESDNDRPKSVMVRRNRPESDVHKDRHKSVMVRRNRLQHDAVRAELSDSNSGSDLGTDS